MKTLSLSFLPSVLSVLSVVKNSESSSVVKQERRGFSQASHVRDGQASGNGVKAEGKFFSMIYVTPHEAS